MSRLSPESFDKICGVLKSRINVKNKSVMMLIVGEMGSGKSLAAVAVASRIDPTFKDDPRVVYTVMDFLETLRSMKKGQAVIFDEAGVGVPAREWQKVQNKVMSILAQILRFKNVCVIFTTPNIRFIDINLRESMNAFVKPRYILEKENINVCTYKQIYVNDNGEVRKRDFVFYDGRSGAAGEVIDPLYVPRPEPELEAYYEKLSIQKKNEKMKELEDMLKGDDVSKTDVKVMQSQIDVGMRSLIHLKESKTWEEMEFITGKSRAQMQRWIAKYNLAASSPTETVIVNNESAAVEGLTT